MNVYRLTLVVLALLPASFTSHAQTPDAKSTSSECSKLSTRNERVDCQESHAQPKTIYLKNVTSQTDANEIMVAVRNLLDPGVKIYLVTSQNALVINTYPEELAKAEALINSLDRPHKTYRLTYTITELDAGKTIGTEHFSMIVADGGHTTIKEGNKIPVATGSYSNGDASSAASAGVQTQFTYLDIGMNFDATLNSVEGGAFLKTKVEQSSLGQPSTIAGVQEPVVRQTVLEGNSFLSFGRPVMLGSVDVPNSTHHFDIAVAMDAIR